MKRVSLPPSLPKSLTKEPDDLRCRIDVDTGCTIDPRGLWSTDTKLTVRWRDHAKGKHRSTIDGRMPAAQKCPKSFVPQSSNYFRGQGETSTEGGGGIRKTSNDQSAFKSL